VAQDLLQQLQAIRAKSVTNLEAEHQRLLTDTLRRLEQEVVSITSTLPIQDGVLFNTRLAIEIRPKLQQAIEELYLKDVQTFINDYDKIAGTIVATYGKLPIPSEFKQITEADLVTIQQLKKIAFSQFQNLGNEFTNTLAQEIYQSTLVGKPFANVVQTIRDKINGIYQQADTVKREELVNFIQDQKIKGKVSSPDVQTAIDELKQTYGSTVTGDNLYSYSSQIVGDALMGFDGQFAKYRADEIGLTSFIYYGSIIRDSRDFCVEHVNKIFTENEARDIWLKDWQGKSGSDPFLDRGGYNCRHHWQPVSPDWGTINSDGTFDYTTDSTTTTFTQPPQPVQTNIPIVPPIRTTRAVAAAPEVFTADNTFVADKSINSQNINKVLQSLEGQKEALDKVAKFIAAKNIVQIIVPTTIGNKAVKNKLLPEINKIYKNITKKEFPAALLKGGKRFGGYTYSSEDFFVNFVDKKDNINFLKANAKEMQKTISDTLERTLANKGEYSVKIAGKQYNLDWTFSSVSKKSGNEANEKIMTMMHELGHQVHFWATTDGSYSTKSAASFPKTGISILTKYGQTNDREFHAELFTAYSLNKPALLKFNPALVTYMESLLDKAINSTVKHKR
jgi:hypothetical protein